MFGVKDSLIVSLSQVTQQSMADQYDVPLGTALLHHDFILVSDKESGDLRARRSKEALERLGRQVKIVEGLPVPDVD